MGAPVLTYEAPAIAAMNANPRPTAFPIQTRALAVPMPGHAGLTAVMIGVGASSLTFTEDAKTGTYTGDAVVIASLSGPAMRKQSQEYKMTGKLDQLAQVKSGALLFFRTPELQAGKYDVSSVVYDAVGSKASVAASTVTVPTAESVTVGDLFLVSRFEKIAATDTAMANHPLVANGLLLCPSFGEPLSKAKKPELDLALPLVINAGEKVPTATLQVLQGGQKLAEIDAARQARRRWTPVAGHAPAVGGYPGGHMRFQGRCVRGQQQGRADDDDSVDRLTWSRRYHGADARVGLFSFLYLLIMVTSSNAAGQAAPPAAAEPIAYTLRFPDPSTHYVEVEARCPPGAGSRWTSSCRCGHPAHTSCASRGT
jgi:hypothetical protein